VPRPEGWNVELTDEYFAWFGTLDEAEQEAVRSDIAVLERLGPSLGRPYVDSIKGSRHANMKELRTMHRRRHLRSLFAFDPAARRSCSSARTRPAKRGSTGG
jgi:hypothetical protein